MTKYAKLLDPDTIDRYPINLRTEFPNTSFPRRELTDEECVALGLARVREIAPVVDEGQDLVELAPVKRADGLWRQRWQNNPNPARLAALKARAQEIAKDAGIKDWLERTAAPAQRFADAATAIAGATSAAEIRAALGALGESLQRSVG
jgi:hypothetical protein